MLRLPLESLNLKTEFDLRSPLISRPVLLPLDTYIGFRFSIAIRYVH